MKRQSGNRLMGPCIPFDLYRQIPGEDNPLVLELKSLAMHDAYHIGQIVSEIQGAWARK